MKVWRNKEGYTDYTAGAALWFIKQGERKAAMEQVQKKMAQKLAIAERLLRKCGCHLEGSFKIVDDKKNIYLKVDRRGKEGER